jgi:hypothetical protein
LGARRHHQQKARAHMPMRLMPCQPILHARGGSLGCAKTIAVSHISAKIQTSPVPPATRTADGMGGGNRGEMLTTSSNSMPNSKQSASNSSCAATSRIGQDELSRMEESWGFGGGTEHRKSNYCRSDPDRRRHGPGRCSPSASWLRRRQEEEEKLVVAHGHPTVRSRRNIARWSRVPPRRRSS